MTLQVNSNTVVVFALDTYYALPLVFLDSLDAACQGHNILASHAQH